MKVKRRYLINMPYLERLEFISTLPNLEFFNEIVWLLKDYPDYDQSYLLKVLNNKLKNQTQKPQLSDLSFADIATLSNYIRPDNFIQFLNILLNIPFYNINAMMIANIVNLKNLPEPLLKQVYEILDNHIIESLEKSFGLLTGHFFEMIIQYVLNNPCDKIKILEKLLDLNNNQAIQCIKGIILNFSVNDPIRKIIQKQLDIYEIIT